MVVRGWTFAPPSPRHSCPACKSLRAPRLSLRPTTVPPAARQRLNYGRRSELEPALRRRCRWHRATLERTRGGDPATAAGGRPLPAARARARACRWRPSATRPSATRPGPPWPPWAAAAASERAELEPAPSHVVPRRGCADPARRGPRGGTQPRRHYASGPSLGGHYSHTLIPSRTIIGPRVAGGCVAVAAALSGG